MPRPRRSHYGPLRTAVLCSQQAPGLMHLLNSSPDRGVAFDVVCCVTTERTFDEEVRVERRGIPTLVHPIADFYAARGAALFHDFVVRAEYDAATLALVEPFYPDLILLDGYRYLVTPTLLQRFRNRVINLHLSETRATVHLVSDVADAGAPIVRSRLCLVPPPVDEPRTTNVSDAFEAHASAHQEWTTRSAAGPVLAAAFRLIATGAVDLDECASSIPGSTLPWQLDRDGSLTVQELEFA